MMKYTKEDLKIMQGWSLERKILVTQTRILEWLQHYEGKVYISFSGGKDSTVLLDLVRRVSPEVEAVFIDTGLEYPEIRQFVKTKENVTWLRPEIPFNKVIENCGFPIVSKDISEAIRYARKGSHWAINKFKGLNTDGTISKFKQTRYVPWDFLIDAPFKISDECCLITKERPAILFEKSTGKKPIIATMAEDSRRRADGYKKVGCNAFELDRPRSTPMGFWTKQDVLQYIKLFHISYSSIYGEIIEVNRGTKSKPKIVLTTTGEQRTGCMFCMFGCHLGKVNRFQRMAHTHPKQYDYCINKLGCGKVLDYLGVDYSPIKSAAFYENPDLLDAERRDKDEIEP